MWDWLKRLLKVSVGTIIFGLVLYAIGLFIIGSMMIAFLFGLLFWFGWEMHIWEKNRELQRVSLFTVQKEVITREIVKVKCAYCGMLVESTLSRCPNCNGLMK